MNVTLKLDPAEVTQIIKDHCIKYGYVVTTVNFKMKSYIEDDYGRPGGTVTSFDGIEVEADTKEVAS